MRTSKSVSISILALIALGLSAATGAAEDAQQLEGKRMAVLVKPEDSAEAFHATLDYLMDRGARVHVLAERAAPARALKVCEGQLSVVELTDAAGQRRPVAVARWTDEVVAQDYDAIYAAAGQAYVQVARFQGDTQNPR